MPCVVCGDICHCPEAAPAPAPRWLPDAFDQEALACGAPAGADVLLDFPRGGQSTGEVSTQTSENCDDRKPEPVEQENSLAWRHEIADRLNRYNARRKPRPPRYPSLQLRFEPNQGNTDNGGFVQAVGTGSAHAFSLDHFEEHAGDSISTQQATCADGAAVRLVDVTERIELAPIAPPTAKIIEFPRSSFAPPPPLEVLADPVFDRPRILEAPEIVPPPPALGGILIESQKKQEPEKRPGIDIPLKSAPLLRRVLAAILDAGMVAAACALFGVVFWKVAAIRPPMIQIVEMAAGLFVAFWGVTQYLLVVYGRGTPGLFATRLQLARFDGSAASRRLRHWRVLASFLSAASLGMGYLWVFLDEDGLCWHDRITRTYLAPKTLPAAR